MRDLFYDPAGTLNVKPELMQFLVWGTCSTKPPGEHLSAIAYDRIKFDGKDPGTTLPSDPGVGVEPTVVTNLHPLEIKRFSAHVARALYPSCVCKMTVASAQSVLVRLKLLLAPGTRPLAVSHDETSDHQSPSCLDAKRLGPFLR